MQLTNAITEYNETWPHLFEEEAKRLKPVFGSVLLDLHHIGSTAVVGLNAKPEIDILAVVSTLKDMNEWEGTLMALGYKCGNDLSESHHFFKRDIDGVRTHKLHICVAGHPTITRMLMIRDHLRRNTTDREAYRMLKLNLEQNNKSGIKEYLRGKAPFLDELYRKIENK